MTQTYGFPLEVWEEAKEETRQILIQCARDEKPIAYSELVAEIHTIRFEPQDPRLGEMLGQISSAENVAGRGMLSLLVVHKGGDHMPGPGFFNLAESLGKQFDDNLTFWVKEFEYVIEYWRGTQE
ncbi:MAG: hypothetical protein F4Y50_11375 [Dehalococcoidia bacterium]|nr:hypothetical protein [Dehalococcoidia bacterium]